MKLKVVPPPVTRAQETWPEVQRMLLKGLGEEGGEEVLPEVGAGIERERRKEALAGNRILDGWIKNA